MQPPIPHVSTALQAAIGPEAYATWLHDVTVNVQPHGVQLGVKSLFIKDFLEREYGPQLTQGVQSVCGPIPVSFILTTGSPSPAVATPTTIATTTSIATPIATSAVPTTVADESRLDARYTFETYVTGNNNQFAVAAAKRVAQGSGQGIERSFNPLFVHGKVGLGKTHLMQAIGWELRTHAAKKITYLSAEQFVSRFVRALRDRNTTAFKDLYRNVDVLMIDDVQFIAGKEASQEEFFHTFNTLVAEGKQIILTADRSPHELDNIEERLKSRLGGGLTVEIKAPDIETRLAILSTKAEAMELTLDADVLQFLAQNVATNVRELEGALNRLAAFAKLTGATITPQFAREQLRDLLQQVQRTVTLDDIKETVATHFHLKIAELVGPSRTKRLAEARQLAMYLAKQLTQRSYPDIGRAFGGRDHTTVMHAVQKVAEVLPTSAEWQENLSLLQQKLQA